MNDTPETVLEATLDSSETEPDLMIEATLEDSPVNFHESWKRYAGKLRTLSRIHQELMPAINAKREATHEAFFRPDDQYIEETPESCDLLTLTINSMKNASQG